MGEKTQGKSIAASLNIGNQVRSPRPGNPNEYPLGYRGIGSSLTNRSEAFKKVELPVFEGSYLNIWLNRAERFFRLGNYSDQD